MEEVLQGVLRAHASATPRDGSELGRGGESGSASIVTDGSGRSAKDPERRRASVSFADEAPERGRATKAALANQEEILKDRRRSEARAAIEVSDHSFCQVVLTVVAW